MGMEAFAFVAAAVEYVGFTGIAAATISTAISGAIVGAVVGGLSALVTGGDIGSGMLWGAVGGAVLGGISGYMGYGELAAGSMSTVTTGADGLVTQAGEVVINQGTAQAVADAGLSSTVSSGLLSNLSDGTQKVIAEGVGSGLTGMLQASSVDEATEASTATSDADRELYEAKYLAEIASAEGMNQANIDQAQWEAEFAVDTERDLQADAEETRGSIQVGNQ